MIVGSSRPRRAGALRRAALMGALLCPLLAARVEAVLVVTEPWVRPAGRGATTEVFMELLSSDGADLAAVRSDVARTIVLLDARGRPVPAPGVALRPGARTLLAPGHARVALRTLTAPLQVGDRVLLTLVLRGADGTSQEVDVDAEVRRRSPTDDHKRHAHAHAHPH